MAERPTTEIRLRTEIDQEKVDTLRDALDRFELCQQEMRSAISGVQQAVYAMNDAISIRRVDG
jgi:hypothetical protein